MSKQKRKRKNQSTEEQGTEEIPTLPITNPLQLRYYGDPVLRRKAEPVNEITEVELKLADEMLMTLRATGNGIGLAATQIGILKRFLIVDLGTDENPPIEPLFLFNPEILSAEGESIVEEGCLSIPDVRAEVRRPEKIVLKAMNLNSEYLQIETDGLLARVLQHEIDHLNGVLFIDRISGIIRQLLRADLEKIHKADRPL